jgi:hypothetical protein
MAAPVAEIMDTPRIFQPRMEYVSANTPILYYNLHIPVTPSSFGLAVFTVYFEPPKICFLRKCYVTMYNINHEWGRRRTHTDY